jgi:GNAT superfamily N-acetyltransferase
LSAYRFCRTDDIELLVDALNRCWAPHFPEEPLMTAAAFKRLIREQQVWCSSCMVAFSGTDPIGVLIGAKRSTATLIYRIAVHPDHLRQGHGRHLLTSLSSKLAILGPPRLVAEVPATFAPACNLFRACGYEEEAVLTDYVIDMQADQLPTSNFQLPTLQHSQRFVIPVTVDDLAANGLLDDADTAGSWGRAHESIAARKDEIAGLAVASDERLEAYVLYVRYQSTTEIVSLRSVVDDDGLRVRQLVSQLNGRGASTLSFSKVHASEVSAESLAALGFRPLDVHRLYAARARSA